MDIPKEDNLGELGDGPFVIDPTRTNLYALPGQRVSIVLHSGVGKEGFKPVIATGTVKYLEFDIGRENPHPSSIKSLSIGGQNYNLKNQTKGLLKELHEIHKTGVESAKRFSAEVGVKILGAEEGACPRTVFVNYIHVELDAKQATDFGQITTPGLAALVLKINTQTGRDLRVVSLPGAGHVLVVPCTWLLQNLTGLEATRQTADRITKPVAFPSIGTRIVYMDEHGVQQSKIVMDFEIPPGGSRVDVILPDEDGGDGIYVDYSKIYAKKKEEQLNPAIVRVISPEEYADISKTYLPRAREYIYNRLRSWTVWRVSGLKVLVATFADEEEDNKKGRKGGRNGHQQEKPRMKYQFVLPSAAIENPDFNPVSFEYGEVEIDGQSLRVTNGEEEDPISAHNDTIEFHNIPETSDESVVALKSLVFNAVNGHATPAFSARPSKPVFLSTKNVVKMSMTDAPLFSSHPPSGRPVADVCSLHYVFGFIGKSTEDGYENQDVLCWTEAPEALRNFYAWVITSKTGKLAKQFDGKKPAEIRTMFECEEYPNLVDAYNFMLYGFTDRNPTKDTAWTNWFAKSCLYLEPEDILASLK